MQQATNGGRHGAGFTFCRRGVKWVVKCARRAAAAVVAATTIPMSIITTVISRAATVVQPLWAGLVQPADAVHVRPG